MKLVSFHSSCEIVVGQLPDSVSATTGFPCLFQGFVGDYPTLLYPMSYLLEIVPGSMMRQVQTH